MASQLQCSCCKEIKSVELFPRATKKKRGYAWECKACKTERRDQKKASMSSEEWALQNKKYYLKSQYGITLEDYNIKLKEQQHKCAICSADEVDIYLQTLYVDHCHTTGKIRGLLCHSCNAALGLLKDSQTLLDNAKDYLRKYS